MDERNVFQLQSSGFSAGDATPSTMGILPVERSSLCNVCTMRLHHLNEFDIYESHCIPYLQPFNFAPERSAPNELRAQGLHFAGLLPETASRKSGFNSLPNNTFEEQLRTILLQSTAFLAAIGYLNVSSTYKCRFQNGVFIFVSRRSPDRIASLGERSRFIWRETRKSTCARNELKHSTLG